MRFVWLAVTLVLVANSSFASSGFRDREGLLVVPHADLDIGSVGAFDSRINFSGGALVEYLWKLPGVYFGMQYQDRGLKLLGLTSNAGFIDMSAGFMLVGRRGDIFTEDAMHQLRLGFFYALPMGDYKVDLGTFPTKGFVGIGIEATTFYPITDTFALGLNVYSKFGISSSTSVGDSKALNLGFGLAATF